MYIYFIFYWKSHQISPTVVNLKGRLPQKLQSKSTLSCEIVQIHSLFDIVLLRNRNNNFTEIDNRRILFFCDGFRKIVLGIDLMANTFRGSIQNTRIFSIFSSFIFCSIIYLFEKWKGLILAYPQRIVSLMVMLTSPGLFLNPLPHMPILGSSNSAANKSIVSTIWTKGV